MSEQRVAHPLITDDWRVAGAVYRDPQVFEAEIDTIFSTCWIYVAHESEVASSGDYKLSRIGRQPVIVVRGGDDASVRVLFNRCRHRAASVCQTETGNTNFFKCAYHAWTYANDGRLVGVPFPDAYGEGFDKAAMGLVGVPRVDSYRGFVFANLDPAAPSLADYLGNARRYLDYMADFDIELNARAHKLTYKGNWKLQLENTIDLYHFSATHRSWLDILKDRMGMDGGILDQAMTNQNWRTLDLGNGHAALEVAPLDVAEADRPDVGVGDLIPFNLVIFPSLAFVGSHLRVVTPIAVDDTEVTLYPMIPRGIDDDRRRMILRDHQAFYGPAGAGSTDDVEVGFDRVTDGLRASATTEDWLLISRGLEREVDDHDAGIRVGRPADEVPQRAFYRRWLEVVSPRVDS